MVFRVGTQALIFAPGRDCAHVTHSPRLRHRSRVSRCKVDVALLSEGGAYHGDTYTLGEAVPTRRRGAADPPPRRLDVRQGGDALWRQHGVRADEDGAAEEWVRETYAIPAQGCAGSATRNGRFLGITVSESKLADSETEGFGAKQTNSRLWSERRAVFQIGGQYAGLRRAAQGLSRPAQGQGWTELGRAGQGWAAVSERFRNGFGGSEVVPRGERTIRIRARIQCHPVTIYV